MLFLQGVLSANLSSIFPLKTQGISSWFRHFDFQGKDEHLIVGGRSACEGEPVEVQSQRFPRGCSGHTGKRGLCWSRGRCPSQHPKKGRETLADLLGFNQHPWRGLSSLLISRTPSSTCTLKAFIVIKDIPVYSSPSFNPQQLMEGWKMILEYRSR